jgi:hypothetical protein
MNAIIWIFLYTFSKSSKRVKGIKEFIGCITNSQSSTANGGFQTLHSRSAIPDLENQSTNGKTDATDLQIGTDFWGIFCGKPVPFRKKNPFESLNPFHPFYHSYRFFLKRELLIRDTIRYKTLIFKDIERMKGLKPSIRCAGFFHFNYLMCANSWNSGRNTHFATSISKKRCYFAKNNNGFRILYRNLDSEPQNLNSKIHIPKSIFQNPNFFQRS